MIPKAQFPSPMAETQPHRPLPPPLFIKLAKLLLIPTATAAMIISQYYYHYLSWNNHIIHSFRVSATLESMRRLIESPPLVYLVFNLIVVSIVLSNTFSFRFSLALSKRTTSPAAAVAPISDTTGRVEIESSINTPITTPFPSQDRRSPKTASFLDEKLIERNPITETASLEEREIAVVDWLGPEEEEEEEEGGGGGDSDSDGGGDTIEDTWRAIMEGKEKDPTRRLRKSDTWSERSSRARHLSAVDGKFKKSETFREGGPRWRRPTEDETEMEEVDRRAEAFISKIRGDIWLQRKESDQRFFDMINRGL